MNIHTDRTDSGLAVIRPEGRLNMVSAPRLRAVVSAAVEAGSTRVVVDMSGVESLDSSGLGALVAGLKTTRQHGGDLRISALSAQVLTVLRLTNLDRVLRPYATVEEAFGER